MRPLSRLWYGGIAFKHSVRFAGAVLIFSGSVAGVSQGSGGGCSSGVPEAFGELARLLTRLQQLGVALGLSLAALGYIVAGILYMVGGPDRKRQAKSWFVNTSIGLMIVLLSGGFVEFIRQVLCGGG